MSSAKKCVITTATPAERLVLASKFEDTHYCGGGEESLLGHVEDWASDHEPRGALKRKFDGFETYNDLILMGSIRDFFCPPDLMREVFTAIAPTKCREDVFTEIAPTKRREDVFKAIGAHLATRAQKQAKALDDAMENYDD